MRVNVAAASVLGVMLAVVLALLVRNVFVSARTPILWTLGGLVLTIILLPVVEWLSRWIPRLIAAILVLLLLAGTYLVVGYRFVDDLSTEVSRLQTELPEAAADLEQDSQLLQDFRLSERGRRIRATAARPDHRPGRRGLHRGHLRRRRHAHALPAPLRAEDDRRGLLPDPRRATTARAAPLRARGLGQHPAVLLGSLATMFAIGLIVYLMCRLFDLPAPTPLAVVAGILSALPYFGVALGALPVLLLSAGLTAGSRPSW